MKKIVLTGYMGSGKSTIGRLLASELAIQFIDLDLFIENKENLTVSEIFETRGEIYFRKIESEVFGQLISNQESFVLALGGGTPCYANNHLLLQNKNIDSYYLQMSVSELTKRLETEKNNRPLIANLSAPELESFVGQHVLERSFFYRFAKETIKCNDLSAFQIATLIMQKHMG
jgi:shikimate kinase